MHRICSLGDLLEVQRQGLDRVSPHSGCRALTRNAYALLVLVLVHVCCVSQLTHAASLF